MDRWQHEKRFRIRYWLRDWIGRPNPYGYSDSFVYSDDPSWIHETALCLKRNGCWVVEIETQQMHDDLVTEVLERYA